MALTAKEKAAAENFLPYRQFAHLIRDGMTAIELGRAIFARLGLSEQTHRLLTKRFTPSGTPFRKAVKGGLVVVRKGSPEHEAARGCAQESAR